MLNPDQIQDAGDAVAALYSDMESQMLDHLVDILLDVDKLDQKSITELNLLAQSMTPDLQKIVESNKEYIADEVYETCETFLKASDKDDIKRLGKGDLMFPQQLAATVTGMQLVMNRNNIKMVEGAKTAFLNASIEAVTKVNSGLFTTERALHQAVRKLEGEGIPIEYVTYQNSKTGKTTITNHVDVAVRRHIRTQIAQDSARMTMDRLNALDVALVEVSSHEGARPTHQAWEGRVYSLKGDMTIEGTRYRDFYSATRYGSVDGLCGANCRHSFAPYIHGAPRSYEPNPSHPSGLPNDEVYKLTQKQRYLERKIRDDKRQLRGAQLEYEKHPDKLANKTNLLKAKETLAKRQAQMRDFIKDANAKCKPGTSVLQRSPRREWAGDMPKNEKVKKKSVKATKTSPTSTVPKSNFKPAKTIEEAVQVTQKYIKDSGFSPTFKNTVDVKGLDLEVVNSLNRALETVFSRVDIPKLSGIKAISPTSSQGKKAFTHADAVAAYNFVEGGIFLNKNLLKNPKAFAKHVKEAEDAYKVVVQNINKLSGAQRELAERYKAAGRSLVDGTTIEGAIIHELGHHVDWNVFSAQGNTIREQMSKYANSISGYAGMDAREYMAESFAAHMKGEVAILDPEYVKFLQQANKGSKPIESAPANANMREQIAPQSVKLSKGELAHVTSEINTWFHGRFDGKKKGTIYIDDYFYEFEIKEFNEYTITRKIKIDDE